VRASTLRYHNLSWILKCASWSIHP
jgi:hypothetical protein